MTMIRAVLAAALALPGPAAAQQLKEAVRSGGDAVHAGSPESARDQAAQPFENPGGTQAVQVGDFESLGSKPAAPKPGQAAATDIGMPQPEQPGEGEPQEPKKKPSGAARFFKGLGLGLLGLITGPFLYGAAGVLWAKAKSDESDSKWWLLATPFAFVVGFIAGIFMGPYKGFKEGYSAE